jgi:hypothetical protein
MSVATGSQRGRVLVVEDEFLVSLGITALLEDTGFNIAGESIWPVALTLKARGVPMLFLSGYLDANVRRPPELLDVPICVKPLSESEVSAVIDQLVPRT